MSRTYLLVTLLVALLATAVSAEDIRRMLYVTSRDGAGGKGRQGIYVYDIDNSHRLLKFISLPKLGGTRGACAEATNDRFYIAHNNNKLLCMDLRTEKILWQNEYTKEQGGCDRIGVTPDGKKLYAPGGWWNASPNVKVIDGENGKLLKEIKVAPNGGLHNLIVSLDGTRVYCGSVRYDHLTVIDTKTDTIVRRVGPISRVIQPFTINGSQTLAYINTHLHAFGKGIGFEIGDLKTGKILHVVKVDGLEHRKQRCHGVGLTPDEKEVWLVDQGAKKLHIFDNTVMPPTFKQSIDVAAKTHGWICFSTDGDYAYPDTGEVFDVRTKKVVAHLTDQPAGKGNSVNSSKFVEIHFKGSDVVYVSRQMGVGRVMK